MLRHAFALWTRWPEARSSPWCPSTVRSQNHLWESWEWTLCHFETSRRGLAPPPFAWSSVRWGSWCPSMSWFSWSSCWGLPLWLLLIPWYQRCGQSNLSFKSGECDPSASDTLDTGQRSWLSRSHRYELSDWMGVFSNGQSMTCRILSWRTSSLNWSWS